MPFQDVEWTNASLIDVSAFPVVREDRSLVAAGSALVDAVVEAVERKNGFAVLHGTNRLLAMQGLDVKTDAGAECARRLLEGVFRLAAARFDLALHSPVAIGYDRVARMDVDGYNKNRNFTPNGDHTAGREFVTTKCVHYDAATPFIANIYGPSKNIAGGLPMICDTRRFCREKGIEPSALVENIPNNYNVAVKAQYCDEILSSYSFALDAVLEEDVVMVVLFNEVDGGLAHAATRPEPRDPTQPALRPITHLEFQVPTAADLERWYEFYGLRMPKASDHDNALTPPRYHQGELGPFRHTVRIPTDRACHD